jgi:hypothetical protein
MGLDLGRPALGGLLQWSRGVLHLPVPRGAGCGLPAGDRGAPARGGDHGMAVIPLRSFHSLRGGFALLPGGRGADYDADGDGRGGTGRGGDLPAGRSFEFHQRERGWGCP